MQGAAIIHQVVSCIIDGHRQRDRMTWIAKSHVLTISDFHHSAMLKFVLPEARGLLHGAALSGMCEYARARCNLYC